MPMHPYVIRQGDHLARLAAERGFDPVKVWNDSANEGLRAVRASPQVLAPGDVLYIPEPKPRTPMAVTVGASNRFKMTVPRATIRVSFARHGRRHANAAFRVDGFRGAPIEGTTTAEGLAEFDLPLDVRAATLTLVEARLVYRLRVGGLDPASEASGARSRLRHLGYLPTHGHAPSSAEDSANELTRALRAFQIDHGLEPTGQLDSATQAALAEAHDV